MSSSLERTKVAAHFGKVCATEDKQIGVSAFLNKEKADKSVLQKKDSFERSFQETSVVISQLAVVNGSQQRLINWPIILSYPVAAAILSSRAMKKRK